jgi:hypothetical protein
MLPNKGATRNILLITLPLLVVLVLIGEVVFRFFLPACQLPAYCFDNRHGIMHLQPNRTGIFTAGPKAEERRRWRTNNYGWNSEIDYTANAGLHQKLITIIGDSYIEGFSVNVSEGLPALIRKWAGKQVAVYSLGISGAPLSQYLNMARYVNEIFKPAVLVINVVHNDFDESLAPLARKAAFLQLAYDGNGFKEIPPTPFANSFFLSFATLRSIARFSSSFGRTSGFQGLINTTPTSIPRMSGKITESSTGPWTTWWGDLPRKIPTRKSSS